jgi:hypothetical protein
MPPPHINARPVSPARRQARALATHPIADQTTTRCCGLLDAIVGAHTIGQVLRSVLHSRVCMLTRIPVLAPPGACRRTSAIQRNPCTTCSLPSDLQFEPASPMDEVTNAGGRVPWRREDGLADSQKEPRASAKLAGRQAAPLAAAHTPAQRKSGGARAARVSCPGTRAAHRRAAALSFHFRRAPWGATPLYGP